MVDVQAFGFVAATGIGGVLLLALLWWHARRRRARAASQPVLQPASQPGEQQPGPDPLGRRIERRMEEIEAVQAVLAERLAELAQAEDEGGDTAKLQAMAASILGLVRDKNAQLDTALAGIDQIRARLKTLEAIGDLAEARGLFETLRGRMEALETGQTRAAEAARAAETRLAEAIRTAEARNEALLEARIDARVDARAADLRTDLRADPRGGDGREEGALAEIGVALAGLHAQKEAAVETLYGRLSPLEARLGEIEGRIAGLDPRAALDRFAERLEALRAETALRLAERGEERDAAEAQRAEAAIAELAAGLARLYERRDDTLGTLYERLGPLEAGLAELAGRMSGLDPQALFDRFGARLDAARAEFEARIEARLDSRIDALRAERSAEALADDAATGPAFGVAFGEIAEALARLAEGSEDSGEAVFARLGGLEARLAELEGRARGEGPEVALARFGARLDALHETFGAEIEALRAGGAYADLARRFAELAGEGSARADSVLDRLVPLEGEFAALAARVEGLDPAAALDRFAARLDALRREIAAETASGIEAAHRETQAALDRLGADRDAAMAAVFGRLGPIEARLADLEGRIGELDPEGTLARFGERLAMVQARLGALDVIGARMGALDVIGTRLGTLEGGAEFLRERVGAIAADFARLGERGVAVETLLERLGPLEAGLVGIEARFEAAGPARDHEPALARLDERMGALAERVAGVERAVEAEAAAARPDAALLERLSVLAAEREAALAAVLGRLAPLEARLASMESSTATGAAEASAQRGELAALAGEIAGLRTEIRAEMAAELRAAEAAATAERDTLRAEIRASGEERLALIGERLAGLHERREAAVEAILSRIGMLEEKLGGMEVRVGEAAPRAELAALAERQGAMDPEAALDRFAARLDAAQEGLQGQIDALREENPLGDLAARLAALYAQKDATLEAVLGWLAPLEAKLAALEAHQRDADPSAALDRFAARLEAAREGLQGQIDALRAENPFGEIAERLAALYAQKDATVETVFARLAPLEAALADLETRLCAVDPAPALDGFAARIEALGDRLGAVEAAPDPYPALAERLAAAQEKRDAASEAVLARLVPLETKLDGVEARVDTLDPAATLARFAERVEAAERAQGALAERIGGIEDPGGALAALRAELHALRDGRDAALEAAHDRIAGLERALVEIETRGLSEAEARAEAQAIAAQMVAARTVEAETRLFASRLALLEASLPRLSLSQSLMMQALERHSVPWDGAAAPALPDAAPDAAPGAAPDTGLARARGADLPEIWRNPRVVSLHHSGGD